MINASLKNFLFPLGTVIRHKRFKGKFSRRIKPRYLIYFGKLPGLDVHIFFTTTSQVSYYLKGPRKQIPYYLFPEGHPCFNKECVLDVEVAYFISEDELKKFEGEIEIKGCLSIKEFKQCLRTITYTDLYLDKRVYNYLRELLLFL